METTLIQSIVLEIFSAKLSINTIKNLVIFAKAVIERTAFLVMNSSLLISPISIKKHLSSSIRGMVSVGLWLICGLTNKQWQVFLLLFYTTEGHELWRSRFSTINFGIEQGNILIVIVNQLWYRSLNCIWSSSLETVNVWFMNYRKVYIALHEQQK